MTAINSAAILAMAREGYCMHQISSVSGVKLETVRGILRAANQNGEFDAALHLSPTKRQLFHNPQILASRAYMYPQVPPMGIARYRDWETDRKSTRLNSSHLKLSRMPSSA